MKKNRRSLPILASALAMCLLMTLCGTVYAIWNGQPDGDDHPYVCFILFFNYTGDDFVPVWSASGVAISDTVLLTAGHATEGTEMAWIWFNPEITLPPSPERISFEIYTNEQFVIGGGPGLPGFDYHDVGVIILSPEVELPRYAELPDAGLVDELDMMTFVDQVGYGVQELIVGDKGPPYWTGELKRYYAPAQLINSNFKHSEEFMKLTANPAKGKGGTSFGDSGGPILLQGTDTILGLTSYGTNYPSKGVSYAQRIDIPDILAWINEISGS